MHESLAGLGPASQLMAALCEIPSPSRAEGAVAAVVIEELRSLGAHVTTDGAGAALGSDTDNIVASWPPTPGAGGTPIMFAAHLDTVPVTAPIEVALVDGHLTNIHPTIL
ncbi:MAG: hypothetical protein RJQ03_01990, partial [Miltoncostaeaceae bacterium]